MPEVSFDGRSFLVDGRRIWLVSGTIHYTRTPRGLWRSRIRAARQAGLNCIETCVIWNAHELQPGVLDFTGERDLRTFVQLIADEGLYCILRPGPYVGAGVDFGGLPAHLNSIHDDTGKAIRLREDHPPFMEATDRYLRELFKQINGLQVNSAVAGPIVLMQVEHQWNCANPAQGQAYLERLTSMMRQHGCTVPIVNCNNLWQNVEGTIDSWSGSSDLPAMMRQLSHLQPNAPAMVMAMGTGGDDCWAGQGGQQVSDETFAYRLAGLIGVGAQFNLDPFHGGTNFGFLSGRTPDSDASYLTTGNNCHPPLGQAGQRGDKYAATKRLCTFASHFGQLLAASDNPPAPAVALTEADHPTAILHRSSSQGQVVMLLKSESDKSKHTPLMLPNGLRLDVPHAGQRTAWVLLDAKLGGVATLNYTSLSPWALIDRKLLVVFGPPGALGVISIDGQHHDVTVPTDKSPVLIDSTPVRVAVLNHAQIDAAYPAPHGLVIGCDGLDDQDKPIPLRGWGTQYTVTVDGLITRKRSLQNSRPSEPRLDHWQALSLKSLVDGSDERYTTIAGPASLETLGQPQGYGWYRLTRDKPATGKVLIHDGGDRLHVYQQGKLTALLGKGDGASDEPTPLKLGQTIVVLADNLGRYSDGQELGKDRKGLADQGYFVKPIKAGKPQVLKQPAGDPFAVTGLAYHQHAGARPMAQAIAWTLKPESRRPIIMQIDALPQPCVISVNEVPIRYYAGPLSGSRIRLLLDATAKDGPMTGGSNTITLELLEPLREGIDIDKHVQFHQTTGSATASDGWAFTPWTIPAWQDAHWRDMPKSLPSQPTWLRCKFEIKSTDTPLWLEPIGMSKGQIILNGQNVGRYWQQTREGKHVGPQDRYYLPEPWLKVGEPNELMLFDEHGRTAEKCRLNDDAIDHRGR